MFYTFGQCCSNQCFARKSRVNVQLFQNLLIAVTLCFHDVASIPEVDSLQLRVFSF